MLWGAGRSFAGSVSVGEALDSNMLLELGKVAMKLGNESERMICVVCISFPMLMRRSEECIMVYRKVLFFKHSRNPLSASRSVKRR